MSALEDLVKVMNKKLDRLCEVILGDPTNPDKPGHNIRLDRLERSDRVKTRVIWILATGVIVAAGEALMSNL